jgi:hypothetical protein
MCGNAPGGFANRPAIAHNMADNLTGRPKT